MQTQILEIHYIGRSKERRPGEFTALGWMNNCWCVILPEQALRKYFDAEDPLKETTLYGVLGISEQATDAEIRSGYRRMALQWHPDQARGEPNAHEIFLRIQEAYQTLSNQTKRSMYNAGLMFAKQSKSIGNFSGTQAHVISDTFGYRCPLRSGLIMCEGEQQGKWFVVNRILAWVDITNSKGQTLVSSWIYGENAPQEMWS